MTQSDRILRHIQDFGAIPQAEAAAEYGIYRLGARIFDLRAAGWPIVSTSVESKNRYGETTRFASYSLAKEDSSRGT